jgi:SPP1 gp7 family putative phage head morphogenesis protein
MADTAHYQTDLKLEEMEKRLSAIYSRAEKEIKKTADEYFSKFAKQDEAKRKLLEQGKITEDEYKKWRKGKVMYGKRFTEMKEQCAKQLLNVNQTALAYVNGELPEVYALNYNALAGSVDGVGGYSFTLVDADTVRNLAVTDTSLLPYKEIDPSKDIPWNMKKINAETLQGILQGESMDKIAKRLRNVQEMNKTQAIRSARTIVTGAENKGRQDSYARAEADGIILQKEWLSTNDGRTRHSHAALDGAIVDQDKKFDNGLMYPGDPIGRPEEVYNCRCTLVAKVNGFKKAQVQKAMAEKQAEEQKTQGWDNLPDSVTDRATAIDKLLTEETGKKSVFNGKVVIDDSIKFNGTANYDGSITLRSKASRKTEIHELLHQHSEGGQNRVYVSIFKNIEEGSVELLAQEICHAKGIKIGQFDYSYTPYVDALRQINRLSGAYKTDYDFAKAVFGKPLEKRAEFLKSLGDSVAKDEKRFFRGALKTLGVK